ncbi:MAG: hypothetical protein KDA78_15705 [Planctomycetaceae bacterium]|nr:hypothetical protein [Planctomycetaceae bacterium]
MAAIVLFNSSAFAKDMSQKDACNAIATKVSTVLKSKAVSKLKLMGFDGLENAEGLKRDLKESFSSMEIETLTSGSAHSLMGYCVPFDEKTEDGKLAYKIVATLNDEKMTPMREFKAEASGTNSDNSDTSDNSSNDSTDNNDNPGNNEKAEKTEKVEEVVDALTDSTKATGVNVDLEKTVKSTSTSAAKKEEVINKTTIDAFKEQEDGDNQTSADLSQGSVKPSAASSFEVKLVLFKDGQYTTTKPYVKEGKPFVDCDFGDIIAVEIYNHSREHVVVSVAVDGVSTFHFAEVTDPQNGRLYETFKKNDLYLIQAGSSLIVEGWFKTLNEVYQFTVTDPLDSVASKEFESVSDCGLITVQFYPAWEVGTPKPAYLNSNRGGGIGKGDVGAANKKPVAVNFEKKVLLANIGVRYNVPLDDAGVKPDKL